MAGDGEELARRLAVARRGSTDALGEVLESCRGYLLAIAQRQLDSDLQAKGGASDLVQETFLKAQRHFDRFEGSSDGELRAWLRQLLLNNLADFTRHYRQADKRQVSREVVLRPGSESDAGGVEPLAAQSSPSGQAMGREQSEAVNAALARLPPDYQQVLRLRYEEESSFDEIGQALGRTANAARKLWARAIERLQEEMGNSS